MKNSIKILTAVVALTAGASAFAGGASAADMSKHDMMMMKKMWCQMSHGSEPLCLSYPKAHAMMMKKPDMKMEPMMCTMSHGSAPLCIPVGEYKMKMKTAV
jgi:hypothetical protein